MIFRSQHLSLLVAKKCEWTRGSASRASKLVLRDTWVGRCVDGNVCVSGKVGIARWWRFGYGSEGAGYTFTSAETWGGYAQCGWIIVLRNQPQRESKSSYIVIIALIESPICHYQKHNIYEFVLHVFFSLLIHLAVFQSKIADQWGVSIKLRVRHKCKFNWSFK